MLTSKLSVQVQALEKEQGDKLAHVQKLENTTKERLWSEDLDGFEAEYGQWLRDADQAEQELIEAQLAAKKGATRKGALFVQECNVLVRQEHAVVTISFFVVFTAPSHCMWAEQAGTCL